MDIQLSYAGKSIAGTVTLEGSKSISNRLLIMQALSKNAFEITHLSPSDDTNALQRILRSNEKICDVGAAGTTMRFLTAYFAICDGKKILTGSERMKNRPVHILVNALRQLGAEIEYLEKEGYPPIEITGKVLTQNLVSIQADVSSQYISALMMIGPVLSDGLVLQLEGKISSYPYIQMTLKLMQSLGIVCAIQGNTITIKSGNYQGKSVQVEGDWSAASYYYSIAAIAQHAEMRIAGIYKNSLQGDAVLPEIYSSLGVETLFTDNACILRRKGNAAEQFTFDFSDCPDLAQTVVVTCAVLGIAGKFTGLESLKIKETDRTAALAKELQKFGVDFFNNGEAWILNGKMSRGTIVSVDTYEDHRMAMCFAPVAVVQPIIIREKNVVNKSYPSFWDDLSSIGFSVSPEN